MLGQEKFGSVLVIRRGNEFVPLLGREKRQRRRVVDEFGRPLLRFIRLKTTYQFWVSKLKRIIAGP
jgi:hypothetical protein